ncbi:Ca2+-binding RTX toxin-like protein [Nocardioides sp. BE266]|uniref:hypothetical protein n=1 Tax=Nocardioides sp. BE266 TaxID=2817725 RepID=UPI00285D1AAA|nr:hypothetical protein [Nocardioides sp. BE266]MDR7254832.1 Ca2+-binding RTX toxin-like protein [Nocardioides sp. BE266]
MSRTVAWIASLLVVSGLALVPAPAGAAPGAPVITGHPTATVETPYAAFTFDAPGSTSYDCRVFAAGTPAGSRPAYADCGVTGSHLTSALADGDWTFEVRGRDGSGAGPSSTRDWTVTSVPVVQWVVEPAGSYAARVVSATFSAAGAASFECRLDGGPYASCGTGRDGYWTSTQLPSGPHTLQVRAIRGSVPGPVATATFTVADPLGISWREEPADVTDGRTVSARFVAAGASQYECRLVRTDPLPDPLPGLSSCGNGRDGVWTSPELEDGAWRLDVRAIDGAEAGSVASSAFVVAVDGSVDWVSRPGATIDGRVVSATFRAPGVHGYQCRAFLTDPVPATLPDFASCGNGQQGSWTSPILEDGAWRLEVRPQDGQGARPVVSTDFTIAPQRQVTWEVRPAGTLAGTAYAAAFRSSGAQSHQCRLDDGDWQACGSGAEGHVTGSAAAGAHQLDVRGVDTTGPGPIASTTFTLVPATGSSTSTDIVVGPQGTIGSSWAAFAWIAEDVDCFRWQLDGADDDLSSQSCYSPNGNGTYAVAQTFGTLVDGPHTLRVQARSTSGDFGAVTTRTFTVDTSDLTRPQLTSGVSGTIATPWAAFSWASAGADCFRWEMDGADDDLGTQSCYSPSGNGAYALGQAFGPLEDGVHVLRVQGRSDAGAFGSVTTRTFTVDASDATRPRFTSGPAQGSTVPGPAAAYSWTADQADCFRWELDGADDDLSTQSCYSPNGNGAYARVQAFANLTDGTHTVRVQGRTVAGTFGPVVTRTFTVDTALGARPRFVSGPADDATIPTAAAAFSWTADEAECFRWVLDGAEADLDNQSCYSPTGNGAYAQAQAFASLADGVHRVRVQGRSFAGTFGPVTTRTFRVNSAPWVTVSSRPRQVLPTGTAAMAWSAPGADCFRWELDGADDDLGSQSCYDPLGNGAYAQEQAFTGLGDGAHLLRVQARSTGGAFGPVTSVPFTVETKAPETAITAGPTGFVSSTGATFTFVADETATFECSLDGAVYVACSTPHVLSGLAQGDHTFAVRAVDLAGKTDATAATRSWTVDTVDPTVIDLTGPSGVVVDPDFAAVLSYQADEPATFECRLVPGAFVPCGTSVSYDGLPDGDYRFEVRAVDRAGNPSAVASREWTLVTDPPETTITAAPSGRVSSTSASISFTSPDSPVTFECQVDGAAYAACASPLQLTGLGQGSHTVRVRAVIQGSLRDPSPAEATWSVDTVGPTTTITSGPSGTVGAGPSSFTFTANEPATFTCRLDGGAPYACSSPDNLGAVGSGSHTFRVRATDAAGNQGTEATRTWVVDAVAPVVTITGQPAAIAQGTTGTVTFIVDDATATVQCRLDGGAWAGCSSPETRAGLAEGTHVLEVRATDPAGNVSDIVSATWRVDTTAPVVTITSGPTGSITTASATLGFTVSESADTFCRVDAGPFAPCTSPHAFTGLADGTRTLQIRATDAAGNTGPIAERVLVVDTVAPTVTITGGPTGTVSQTSATLTFTVDESPVTTQCSLDGAAFVACSSPVTYNGLDQGAHTVRVRATDAAGNTGPSASRTWTVDTPEPETTIDNSPGSPSNDTTPTFTFSSDTAGATFECRLDGAAAFTSCATGVEVGPLADGSHTFRVRAVAAGLADPTPATYTWTVDATAPVVTVTQRPTGVTSVAGSRFVFTVSEPGTVECQVDGGAWQACASPFDPVLADGAHTVRIRATDAAGNVGQTAVMSWTVDGTEPDVVITSGPSGNHASRTATYTWTVDDVTATVECLLDGGTWEPCSGSLTFNGLADGPHSFSVRATDGAGNRGAEGRNFFVDATPPVVTFTDGPSPATTARTAHLVFSVDDPGATLTCWLDGVSHLPCSSPVDLAGFADGSHSFRVEATDSFGNAGVATRAWVVDNTPPTVTITAGPSGTVTTADVSFSFVADDAPATYECRMDNAAFGACPSPRGFNDLPAGPHRFEVRATNGAGLTGPAAGRDFIVAVQGDPDLALTLAARTTSGTALTSTGLGDDFVLRATVTNRGPASSENTVVTVPLSSDLTLAGTLPGGCTSPDADGPVTCAVGSVAAGASTTLDLRVDASFTCTVWGDSGNQTGPAGNLLGTTGNDVICGGGGGDEILGRGGDDVVWGYGPTGTVTTPASVAYGPGARTATAPAVSVVVAGADGGDTITTAQGNDRVVAGGGADVVTTGAGTDTVAGDDGDDRIDTGTGASTVNGGPGADTIIGGAAIDDVNGGDGNDTISTGESADAVDGAAGDDTIDAGAGANTVRGGTGADRISSSSGTILGEDGNDTISGTVGSVDGGTGNDDVSSTNGPVSGGAGDDTISQTVGTVSGGPGDDTINGTTGLVNGDDGNDRITGTAGADTINGGGGEDVISAGAGNDVVDGGDLTDQLRGDAGDDRIAGSFGGDAIWGGDGNDTLSGNTGDDTVRGEAGNDTVNGDEGADTLWGGTGDDLISGGILADTIFGESGDDQVRGNDGPDTLSGGGGDDLLDGGTAVDEIDGDAGDDDISGGNGEDVLRGQDGDDLMSGGASADKILGGTGHDYLDGDAGDDDMNGGLGRDVVRGGAGNDDLDGGGTSASKQAAPRDHWNRLYGDAGRDDCRFGPGLGAQMTNYRDNTCELRGGSANPGQGWLNGSAVRLDRGRNLRGYPG